jgi:hypothetical protein
MPTCTVFDLCPIVTVIWTHPVRARASPQVLCR